MHNCIVDFFFFFVEVCKRNAKDEKRTNERKQRKKKFENIKQWITAKIV